MTTSRKLLWMEGSRITPHHFQQWDNYLEGQLTARVHSMLNYDYGVVELIVNQDALANGHFAVTKCKALFPDGTLLDAPANEPCPRTREIGEIFPATAPKLDVYLAIPTKRPGAANYHIAADGNGHPRRYVQSAANIVDETTGEREMPIGFALGNYRILTGEEIREGYSAIKIAEVVRTPTGQPALNPAFVPSTLDVAASFWLSNQLKQLVEILITKSSTLGEQRRQSASSLVEFTTMESASFWLLHTVNTSIPVLRHALETRAYHPERLYSDLIVLAAQLMTFAPDKHPRNIVKYDHDDLFTTFNTLFREIRDMLEVVISTKCVAIPLTNVRESVYLGRVEDDRLLQEAAFYLAVKAQVSDRDLMTKVPRVVKIAAADHIDRVVGAAMPGVNLNHVSSPPAAIPTRPGYMYFSLETVGRFWEIIRGLKSLGVYVPDEFPEVKVEMYAVKP